MIRRYARLISTPPRRKSSRQRRRDRAWNAIVQAAIVACDGVCQAQIAVACEGIAQHGHHLLSRARGGADTTENCLPCCHKCHAFIHANVEWAEQNGLLLSSNPHAEACR